MKIPEIAFCEEKNRLLSDFLEAVRELNAIQRRQMQTVIDGTCDFTPFELLIHFAQEKKEWAKYAWMNHVEQHRCHDGKQADGASARWERTGAKNQDDNYRAG